jgi:hypothetical protein
MNGYFVDELNGARKKKKRRRRRKKNAATASGLAGLEKRAVEDDAVHVALSEFKWSNSICSSALSNLAPKQKIKAQDTPVGPIGFVERRCRGQGQRGTTMHHILEHDLHAG